MLATSAMAIIDVDTATQQASLDTLMSPRQLGR